MFFRKLNLLLFVCTLFSTLNAQEFPPTEVFMPKDYSAGDQNWAIDQDQNNITYVSNNKGLLEYDGARWNLYQTPNQTILRSIEIYKDKIYTGSYMDFGYWQRNEFGQLNYTSLVNKLEVSLIDDEEIWGIIHLEDWILFQSFERIYVFNTKTETFKIINSKSRIDKMFRVGNTIYFQKINEGIFKLENGNEVKVISSANILDLAIVNIFKRDDELLLQTRENGFYTLKNGVFSQWQINANTLLGSVSVYNSIMLDDGGFMLGTISSGIIQLSKDGNVVLRMNQSNGLSNNTVLSLYQDKNGNVWLGLDNGINVLNLNSPIKVYKDDLGVLGTVYASAKQNGFLYLGTNQGLFVRPITSQGKFNFVEGTKGQVWSLNLINNALFCGHDKGTFLIDKTNANLISKIKGAWLIKEVPNHPNLLIQGNYKGLSIIENTNGTWQFKNVLDGFEISSRYLEFSKPDELLISHEYKGVYKLKLDNTYSKILKYQKNDIEKGVNSSITKYNNIVYYTYKDGMYGYNLEQQDFIKDTILSKLFSGKNYVSGKLINDTSHNKLWGFLNDKILYIQPGILSNEPKQVEITLPIQLRKSKTGYENILHLYDNTYLMGNMEGYLTINLNKLNQKSYELKLNSASNNSLHEPMSQLNINKEANLKRQDNNIHFAYSVTNYNKFSPSIYQYRLLGIYDDWSNWSQTAEILFENLPHGNYTFEARAKVGNQSTNTVLFSFEIEKPWYLKPISIFLYILAFVIMTFIIQYSNTKYYRKQKQKLIEKKERELEIKGLENQKQLMQLKNENLKQDVENKSRELGISTMSLIKRNELLNVLKNELKTIEDTSELKKVIKLIDKNLNRSDDWKLFEEAFNNADKDFLKQIKSKHSALTSNDLRLCAYLRLNLSSKEIAPLLNISPRSVEVKRYRLRKKMNLDHNINLTNYILEI